MLESSDRILYGFLLAAGVDIPSPVFWIRVGFLRAVLVRTIEFVGISFPLSGLQWMGSESIESECPLGGFEGVIHDGFFLKCEWDSGKK